MKTTFDWKKLLPYAVAIVIFAAISMLYCAPALDGKVLIQGDVNNWKGAAQEALLYKAKTGNSTTWTNSMFGGMPTYQITGSGLPSGKIHSTISNTLHLGLEDNNPIGLIFAYFIGFFILLICFGVNPWLSIIGTLALGFSSYFFIIIPAGHITKAMAISYLAPIIGGFYMIMRRKYWIGAPIVLLYGALGIVSHAQMTYYIFMLIGVMIFAELYIHITEKRWKDLGISLSVLIISLLLVVGTKVSWLEMNQSYLKETMRGGHSELTKENDDKSKPAGLDIDYATAWSYGVGETMTLLIPNWEGGASGYNVGTESQLCETMKKQGIPKRSAEQFCQQVPTYHGEKAFTSGPVYIGAIICFLFVLGLIIVKGPYKWALLIATLFSITLAWGRNMMWFTELFFNYFPMYNKFRAVESILVVAEITMPLLAILALQQIINKNIEWKKLQKYLFISGGITTGICLFFALFGGIVDITSSYDSQWTSQVPAWLKDAILEQRTAMIKADAWRSFIFIALGFAVIYYYAWKTQKTEQPKYNYILYSTLFVLILADMIPVNKRFFGNDHFVRTKEADSYFAIQPYEQEILKDNSLNYRVLNLATNTFNDARTSYRLKSIGGYSAAKLRRYQDLIDMHISKEMNPLMQTIMQTQGFMIPDTQEGKNFPVLNMLNMKYAVVPLQNGNQTPIQNPYAMGNCWFVDNVIFVDTPDEECDLLDKIDLHSQAVADKQFAEILNILDTKDETRESTITLTSYAPNCLEYESQTKQDKVVVFSEIYYPQDWHLYIVDEQNNNNIEIPIARVNYTLRAAVIPAGEHKLRMEFKPHALQTDKWSMTIFILLLILSLCGLTYPLWKKFIKKGN